MQNNRIIVEDQYIRTLETDSEAESETDQENDAFERVSDP